MASATGPNTTWRKEFREDRLDKLQILLVEDSKTDARLTIDLLRDACESGAISIDHVTHIQAAEQKLQDGEFGCVLLDLGLPDGSGIDSVSRLIAIAPEVPIVVLTGLDDDQLALQAIREGAQEYALKGQFNSSSMLRLVRHAVERHRLLNEINHLRQKEYFLATHDVLTGLANRQLLRDHADKAIARSRRSGAKFAVAFLDLDGFKAVNDQLGHAAGDQILCSVADVLEQKTRDEDTVARVGGDEFVILIPNVEDVAAIESSLKRIVEHVSRLSAEFEQGIDIGVTVGLAIFPDHGASFEAVVDASDSAMYAGKRIGGQINLYDPAVHATSVTGKEIRTRRSHGAR